MPRATFIERNVSHAQGIDRAVLQGNILLNV